MDAHWLAMTWSLAVEEQFYLILPLLIRLIPLGWLPACLGALIVSAPLIRGLLYWAFPHGGLAGYVLLPARWDSLFLGVLGAWLLRNEFWHHWLKQRKDVLYLALTLSLVVTFVLLVSNQGIASAGMSFGGHTILAVLSLSLILLALLNTQSLIGRIFTARPLVWLGTVSYGVYLFHQPVAGLLHFLLRQQIPRIADLTDASITLLALVVTFSVAAISWKYFERPIVEYGQQWRYNQS